MIWRHTNQQYYPNNQVFDLKEEFQKLLYGDELNPGIGQKVLLRRLSDKPCICWDGQTGSPDPGCRYCQGEGFLWVETLNVAYVAKNFGSVLDPSNVISRSNTSVPLGIADENRALAYLEAKAFPNYERFTSHQFRAVDKLYELKVNASGRLIQPVIRTGKWKILSFSPHRGDNGAVIYIELGIQKEYL